MRHWVAAAALVSVVQPTARAAGQDAIVLVVPFELERFDARVGWLSEAAAVGVTEALDARGVAVVDREARLAALDRLQLPPAASLTRATLIKVAELVGASCVVLGGVREKDTVVTLEARVLDLEKATLTEMPSVSLPASDLLEAFGRVAAGVSVTPASERRRAIRVAMPAFESYVRGLIAASTDAQERLLGRALVLAADYLPAREALWATQTTRGAHEAALETAGGIAGATVPGTAVLEWRVRSALSLVQLRRYDDAFALLSGLSGAGRDAVVPALLGVVQLRRGSTPQTGRAAYYFNQAVERDLASADACFNLGYAYWLEKDAMAAAYWLREAVRRNPADGDAHFVLAAALAASGAGPESERERDLARRLSERWEAAGAGDGVPRGLERLPDRAAAGTSRLAAAISAGTDRDQRELAAFHLAAARRAFDTGRDHEAIREVQRTLYLAPYDADALVLLGRAQARSGLLQDAVSTLKIALWSAESAAVQIELGEALLRVRDVEGARRAAERALVLEPGNATAADLAARARAARGGA